MKNFKSYDELKDIDFIEYFNGLDEPDSDSDPEKIDDFERLFKDLYDLRCDLYWNRIASVQENESELYERVSKRFNKDDMNNIEFGLLNETDDLLFDSKDKFKCEDDYAEYIYIEYRSELIKLDEL